MDNLDKIGDTVIDSIAAYFGEEHNRGIVERLTKQVQILDAEKPAADSAVAGQTVVFTGSLQEMTREEGKALAELPCPKDWGPGVPKTEQGVCGVASGRVIRQSADTGG